MLAWGAHILPRECMNGQRMFYCRGLSENVPHRLEFLKTWILVVVMFWERFRRLVLAIGSVFWGVAFESTQSHLTFSVL